MQKSNLVKMMAVLAFISLIVACAGPTEVVQPTSPPEATQPSVSEQQEEITIALGGFGNELMDPRFSPGDNSPYLRLIFDSCMDIDRESAEISTTTGLCEDWTVDEEANKVTFKVREGVTFHDGSELTAEDVVFSFQRLWDEGTIAPNAGLIMNAVGAPENIVITDTYEFEMTLVGPPLTLMMHLPYCSTECLVVPKGYIEEVGEDEFKRNPVGTGPYKFVEQVLGSHVILEAVDQHYGTGVPAFKKVTLLLVPEESTRVAMLKTGEADAIDVGIERAAELQEAGYNIHTKDMTDVNMVYFQLWQNTPPLNDVRVRQALSYAIDREAIAEHLFLGLAKTSSNFRTSANPGFVEHPPIPYDPEAAMQLLEEAGYGDGFDITLHGFPKPGWPQTTVLETIASNWAAINVNATIVWRDFGSYRADWLGKTLPDTSATLHPVPGKANYTGIYSFLAWTQGPATIHAIPELDALVEEYVASTTIEEFYELETAIDDYMCENYVVLPIVEYGVSFATNEKVPEWVFGITEHSLNLRYFLGGWP